MNRHAQKVAALRKSVFESPGQADPALRRAVADTDGHDVPAPLRGYIEKVARHAYKVTDEDVAALKGAGYSEDQLFELTVSAAVGAALSRLEIGLAAVRAAGEKK